MRAYTTRLLATLVLMASLLAPFASGWAMALGVADGRLFVICTGDGLRTIYVDENGDATQLSEKAVACVLKSAVDTAQAVRPYTKEGRLLYTGRTAPIDTADPHTSIRLSALPRAPPLI